MSALARESLNSLDTGARTAADHSPCVIWAANADGAWTYVNPAWTKLTGQDVADALGMGWLEALPEGERSRVRQAFLDGVTSAEPFEIIHGMRTGGDTPVIILTRVSPDFRGNGQLVGFAGSSLHFDERREHSAPSDKQFRTLIDNSPDIIARLDRNMRHLYINRAVRDSFGIDAQSFIGKTKQELGFPEHIASLYTDVAQEVFDHGEERSFDFVAHGGQTPRHFSTRILPEFEHDGRIDSVLVITYDVTERTLAQLKRDALLIREQAARAQAEAATRARDQFLAIVSHELRSPLNGIQSWTHVLENRVGGDSPSIARAIAGIKTGVQQQVRLIENLLDATQVMSGKLSLVKEPFLVRPAIQAAIDSVARDAAERNITIRTEFPPRDIQLTGNAQRVEQIVANLLTNALKFSVPGADVNVALVSNESEACITIRDTGKGISAEFMPYLFDPFLQADGSNTRRAEGLGLGLTLVQRLAELHGGRITAQSAGENQGSVFSVRLPLQASTTEAALDVTKAVQPMQNSLSVSLADVRVLLVDDQQEARDSLAELLRQRGANVIALESGVRAVDYLGLVKSGGMPHVIICDIAMPEQDGYATLQKIRQMEKREPERFPWLLSAIALTAFGQHDDRMKALASGFQVYLTKPANPFELVSVVEILAHKATAGRVLQNAH